MKFLRLIPRFRLVPSQYSPHRLSIRSSRVHRFGVFALESIPKGRKVIEYAGERLTWTEAARQVRRRERQGAPMNVYFARLNRRWIIDGSVGGSGAQFINHSCDGNLGARKIRGHLLFFSRRRIRAGEELSFDYRLSRESPTLECRCGSPKCRGTVNRK
ncbi:MAG: SET domain-containing protein-lysine N-methyltransferase [Candidatus Acidiferrales bacterium]